MSSTYLTRQQLATIGRQAIAATPGTQLSPSVVDVPGSDLNVVLGLFAVLAENVSVRGAKGQRGAYASLARGPQLDRVIYDRSGLSRFSANPASVDLVLTRPTPGGPTPGTFPATSIVQTADGVQFATDTDAVFGDLDTQGDVSATALIAGTAGNVASYSVVSFSTAPFDDTLTVTNPTPAAGGAETEDDIPFVGRYLAWFPTLARATLAAIELGALMVDGVAVATATELINPNSGYPAAAVQLIIGDLNGNATGDMLTAVANSLLAYRALGIPVFTSAGQVTYQPVEWSPAFQTNINQSLALQRLAAVTVAVAQYLAPGPTSGILYRAKLIAAAQQVPGLIVTDASLVIPAGDVVPTSANQMIRILPTGVTFS